MKSKIDSFSDFEVIKEFANEWLKSNYKNYFKVRQNRMIFNHNNEVSNNGGYFNFSSNEDYMIHREWKKTKVCWIRCDDGIVFKMKNLITGEMDVIKINSDLEVFNLRSVVVKTKYKGGKKNV